MDMESGLIEFYFVIIYFVIFPTSAHYLSISTQDLIKASQRPCNCFQLANNNLGFLIKQQDTFSLKKPNHDKGEILSAFHSNRN